MFNDTKLLELYKHMVTYCGDKTFYLNYNLKLRKIYNKKNKTEFYKLLEPYTELAKLNDFLGYNEHTTVYRGILFRNKKYESWWYENKELNGLREAFPYLKTFPKILDTLTTPGFKNVDQMISTTKDISFALSMADVKYYSYKRNPYIAKLMTRMFMIVKILKKNKQINVTKLYNYFKTKFTLNDLKMDKKTINNFLFHVVKHPIREIIIVPTINESMNINSVETIDTGFLSKHTKFLNIQTEILRDYKKIYKTDNILSLPIEEKDNIITHDTYFIKMKIS
jgi:hypothetical protein